MENEITRKVGTIRARTWALTISLLIALAFYALLRVVFKNNVNLIDLIVVSIIGILVEIAYFPDGELYGSQNPIFIQNKQAYNDKATAINENRVVSELREYCDYEFEQRKKDWLKNEVSLLGLSMEEFEQIKKMPIKDIKRLKQAEINGQLLFFTRKSKKRLVALIYGSCPVEKNEAHTIMSACERNFAQAIKDTAQKYKVRKYLTKALTSVGIGLFFAYISYEFASGIDIAKIAKLISYISTMISTAIISYSQGETCQRVYKNAFYVDLSNFIDGFFEWLLKTKNKEIK